MRPTVEHATVYRAGARFAGWPANYGMWHWGEEIVVVFALGWIGPDLGLHARDRHRPFEPTQARSTDGGRHWSTEPFTGSTPGSTSLSADEHVVDELRAGPHLRDSEFAAPPHDLDLAAPGLAVMCARTDLDAGSRSWFYTSADRCRTWSGPFALPALGQPGLSARTDVVALGPGEVLLGLTAVKRDGQEGRVLAAVVRVDARVDAVVQLAVEFRSWVGDEPAGFAIMPSTIRCPGGPLLCAVRCTDADHRAHWIDLYRSDDDGRRWHLAGRPVASTGSGGNPAAMAALPDGRVVLVYGYRDQPYGLRAVVGDAGGREWGDPIVLADDAGGPDLGYPRCVVLADGAVVVCWYRTDRVHDERYIASLRWRP